MKVAIKDTLGVLVFSAEGMDDFVFEPANVAPANRAHAELLGWQNRLRDCYAGETNDLDRMEALVELAGYYMAGNGDWNVKGSAGGKSPKAAITYQALAKIQGCSVDVMKARVKEQAAKFGIDEKAYLAKVRKLPDIARAIMELQAEAISEKEAKLAEDMLKGLEEAQGVW